MQRLIGPACGKRPMFTFDNTYSRLPERFYERIAPTEVKDPRVVKVNRPLAAVLGADADQLASRAGAQLLAGNVLPDGVRIRSHSRTRGTSSACSCRSSVTDARSCWVRSSAKTGSDATSSSKARFLDAIFHFSASAVESSYSSRAGNSSIDRDVTTKRGLALSPVCSALATTRRDRLQVLRVRYTNSLKRRAGRWLWADSQANPHRPRAQHASPHRLRGFLSVVGRAGVEPATNGLKVQRSIERNRFVFAHLIYASPVTKSRHLRGVNSLGRLDPTRSLVTAQRTSYLLARTDVIQR